MERLAVHSLDAVRGTLRVRQKGLGVGIGKVDSVNLSVCAKGHIEPPHM